MNDRNGGHDPSGCSDRYALRVLRVEAEQAYTLLMLSPELKGVLTHHVKDNSHYCRGKGLCRPDWHKEQTTWKGYVCAAVWNDGAKSWFPCVLEITEACERMMRGRYKRGQVWVLSREKKRKGKRNAVAASYVRTLEPDKVPPAFNMLPNVRYLYHDLEVVIDQDNPMPAAELAAPIPGESPVPAANADTAELIEGRETFKRLYEARYGKNGKGDQE